MTHINYNLILKIFVHLPWQKIENKTDNDELPFFLCGELDSNLSKIEDEDILIMDHTNKDYWKDSKFIYFIDYKILKQHNVQNMKNLIKEINIPFIISHDWNSSWNKETEELIAVNTGKPIRHYLILTEDSYEKFINFISLGKNTLKLAHQKKFTDINIVTLF